MDAMELHRLLQIALTKPARNGSAQYNSVLASLVLALGEEEVEAQGAWFDYGAGSGEDDDEDDDVEVGVHVRLLLQSGLIVTDFDFGFDGAPYVRFFPWSQVREMRLIGRNKSSPTVANAWLETSVGRVEFAGIRDPNQLGKIVDSVRKNLR